jgi:hypothetical protein
MTIVVANPSEVTLLQQALGFSVPGNQILKLYVNDLTPGDADVAGSFTEMSSLGYAAKTLTKGSWSVASSGGVGTASYAQQTWTFSAGAAVTVYGYYVVDTTTGLLLWSERFGTPKVCQNAGDSIVITPIFTLSKV